MSMRGIVVTVHSACMECSKAPCVYWMHCLTLDQRAPDRFRLLAAQHQRRRNRAVPGDGVHDRFKLLWRRHEDLENETILAGQPQHFHDMRYFGKLLQAGLNMFVGRAQTDDAIILNPSAAG